MNSPTKICVIGTGRSGTGHFTAVAADLGMEIGHETERKDGISSWCLVSKLPYSPYGPAHHDIQWDDHLVGMQIRNPLQTIASLETFNKSSWAFILDDAQDRVNKKWWRQSNMRKRAMWHWLDWNQQALEQAQVHWTLGDAPAIGPALAKGTGRTSLASKWEDAWFARKKNANNAHSRVPKLSTLLKTSPPVALRRIKHAYLGNQLDENRLFKEDAALAKDIMAFWEDVQRSSALLHRA